MLQHLHVKNLALIDEVSVTFGEHLNILTGETGAGKSIIIGSIESALGKKMSKDMIRPGAMEAVIELLFWVENQDAIDQLNNMGIEIEDGEVLIKRTMNEKRSINQINGQTVTLRTLKEAAAYLFDLHGQQENRNLLDEKKHLEMVDHFLDTKDMMLLDQCKDAYKTYKSLEEELEGLSMDEGQRLREIGFLEHEVQEIEAANLVPGEDEDLDELYQKMIHSKEIVSSCNQASALTGYDSDQSIGNQLTLSIKEMQEAAALDQEAKDLYEQLLQIEDLLNGFHQQVGDYMDQMDFDQETFFQTEERLNVVNGLKGKYGNTIADVIAYGQEARKKLDRLSNATLEKEKLEEELDKKRKEYNSIAKNLSNVRKKIAVDLQEKITTALLDLNFNSVDFEIRVLEDVQTSKGINRIEFLISTNPGMKKQVIEDVASGGELSRIMLAMKSVLADVDQVETLIFDEIDTGISGETANRVAKKMAVIARDHQVIAITHLPQIASMADQHFYIEKVSDGKETTTIIDSLNENQSLEEIARIISGDERSETSIEHAKEMKSLAKDSKLY